MRISDWSSDVCSSDLAEVAQGEHEQDEADAIAEETDHACADQHPGFGEMRTEQDRKPEVDATGHQALGNALCLGSEPPILRVRLLSMPQARPAPAIASEIGRAPA